MDKDKIPIKKYRKSLGLFELIAFGLGGTIGSGIFIVPSISASVAGPSSIIAWIIACASAYTVMHSLAKASSKYPSTGAFYSIFSKIFNKKLSILLVFMYLVACMFGLAAVASGIGQYTYAIFIIYSNNNTFSFINNINDHTKNNLSEITILFIIEMIVIISFCVINIKGIFISGKTENILTVIKVAPLVVLTIALIPHMQSHNFYPFFSSYQSATNTSEKTYNTPLVTNVISIDNNSINFLKALVIVYWPITGFEICAIPAEETKGERKVTQKSLKIVMIIVIGIYVFLNISLIGSVGSQALANSAAPIATAAGLIVKQSEIFITILGIVAMLSALNAYIIAASRVLQNLSSIIRRHHLNQLSKLGSNGTPVSALIVISSISCISLLLFYGNFEKLADISVIMTLIPYFFICIATFKIFTQEKKTKVIAGAGAFSMFLIIIIYFIFQFV